MRNRKKALFRKFSGSAFVLLLSMTMAGKLAAVSPTPEAIAKWKSAGVYDQKVTNWKAFKAEGGCAAATHSPFNRNRVTTRSASGVMAVDTIRVLTILVDFPDYRFTSTEYLGSPLGGVSADSAMFDSLLFSNRDKDSIFNPSGSFTDYFLENSYGQMYTQGDVVGWLTMPDNYSLYVGGNNGLGGGGRDLALDAFIAAEAAGVDFSKYDNDNNSRVEGIIVIHAGPGAEAGAYGIWSHRASTSIRSFDGVVVSDYTLNPEELGGMISTMGVFCHEYGHILQLPDLYDLGNSGARGLGAWSLMASGNWNRAPGGGRAGSLPAHMDAWSKNEVGFLTLIKPVDNLEQAQILQLATDPVAYWLEPAAFSNQYWIVENRQRVGFDAALPGSGLFIYHVDLFGSQSNPDRYRVSMEQADGFQQLNSGTGNNGDIGDPWPGSSNNRFFSTFSQPNSIRNISPVFDTVKADTTQVGVWDISNADSVMFADLDIAYSRPWVILTDSNAISFTDNPPGGNGDGTFDQGETISVNLTVKNQGRAAWNSVVHLSSTSTDIQFVQNDIQLITVLNPLISSVGLESPLQFFIPADIPSSVETFTITIATDSVFGTGDGAFVTSFEIVKTVGKPQIIIVDNDNGATFERRYTDALDRMGTPYEVWEKKTAGSPNVSDLSGFSTVIWFTGAQTGSPSVPIGGTMTAADETALTGFLDAGGNLMLTSLHAANQLDSIFMADYLHAVKGPEVFGYIFTGFHDNPVGASTLYEYQGGPVTGFQNELIPVNGGQASFFMGTRFNNPDTLENCGVTFDGAHKTVFQTFPFEFLGDGRPSLNISAKDTLLSRVLGFFNGNLAPPSCCLGSSGNVDCDPAGVIDIADMTVLIDHLFISLSPLCCGSAGNLDGDPAGVVDIADLTRFIDHLFISLGPVAACQ